LRAQAKKAAHSHYISHVLKDTVLPYVAMKPH
jgi:hypothetical protein